MHDDRGDGLRGRGQNQGMVFVKLKDWELRETGRSCGPRTSPAKAMRALSGIRGAIIFAFPPPAVIELGTATGFDLMLQDRGALGHEKLSGRSASSSAWPRRTRRSRGCGRTAWPDVPQYKVDIDWEKAGALGVPVSSVAELPLGGVRQRLRRQLRPGGTGQARLRAGRRPVPDAPRATSTASTSATGRASSSPLSAVASGRWVYGSPRLERYNSFPAMNIQGEPAPGRSSGEAMNAMEELIEKLPPGVGFEWTGLSYQQRMSESQAGLLYAFSILVIFLVLAALYESWTVPISIVLALPLGVIGGVIASSLRGMPNDVYFQIGLLTVLGLTTKNAILIVQFAKAHREQGMGLIEATLEAAKTRLRPIVMTSLAFGFGVLPLALASGAGAGAQKAIGTSVLGGMLSGTFLAVFFIPLFFVVVVRLFERKTVVGAPPAPRRAAPGGGELT